MPTDPAISVLLPVRDALPHLPEAIGSLAAQTCTDYEVVAVDDGSTDGSSTVLEAWAARDGRVLVARRPPLGIVAALEHARGLARGRYLARMDADDVALPGRLAAQLALMEARPELVGCGCGVRYVPRSAVRAGARRYERWINGASTCAEVAAAIFVECPIAHPTFFLRADVVDAVGGYVERGWPEDYDLVLRLWAAGGSFAKVPEVQLHWREGPDRLSRTHPRYAPAAFLACKVHYLSRTVLRDRSGVVVWGSGRVGKSLARALAEAGHAVAAFVDLDPRKIGQTIHGAPVVDTSAALGMRDPYHLAAVGQAGARGRIVATLEAAGYVALEDFAAVA